MGGGKILSPPNMEVGMTNTKAEYQVEKKELIDCVKGFLPTLRTEFDNFDEVHRQQKIELDHLNNISKERLKESGCLDFLIELESKHESTGCSPGLYYLLWHYIEINTPQYFLECGTGVSTHLIARAMKEFCYDKYDGDIKLVSMESSGEWYKNALKHPVEHGFVDVVLSDIVMVDSLMFTCSSYKDIPYWPYDCVFVDGPPQMHSVNIDLLRIIDSSGHPVVGIIDGRIKTILEAPHNLLL